MPASTPVRKAADPEVRRSGLGGSDAAAICGLNPWATALDVYLEKRGLTEDEGQSEAAYWGTRLEPVLLREYAIREEAYVLGLDENETVCVWHPDGVKEFAEHFIPDDDRALLDTLRHPEHGFMMCHLDALVLNEDSEVLRLIEAKTSSAWRRHEWGDEGSDEVPREYVVQCQHNAFVAEGVIGKRLPVDLPVLIGGQQWRVFTVEPDEQLQSDLVAIEEDFWQRVQDGDPPPAERDERGLESLKKLFPEHEEGEEVVVTPQDEIHDIVLRHAEARTAVKEAEDREKAFKVQIQEEMGTAARLKGDGYSITWKKTKDREKTDWEGAFEDLKRKFAEAVADPDTEGWDSAIEFCEQLVEAHTEIRPGYRVFRPNYKKLD